MLQIDHQLRPSDLMPKIRRLWRLSAAKIRSIERTCPPTRPSPVFTVKGRYTARGWTDWTRGFQYGSAILQFDAAGAKPFLTLGRDLTARHMAEHTTHFGVHDHGFNIVSTFGNLLRLMNEGRIAEDRGQRDFYELALKCSAAVQAQRWALTDDGTGYIYSFNGPHSLFVDTIRSCRSLALGHRLGHVLRGEQDESISLLERMIQHAANTAKYNVYYGQGRDDYDVRGRTAHEAIFNSRNGAFRGPGTQQGYSPFTTWTRGLAWAMCGFAELLEFIATLRDQQLKPFGGRGRIERFMLRAARACSDFYIANTPTDGIPYWDTGAPGLVQLGDWRDRPADPFNDHEPVDSSAAAIAAQGLLRLGRYLKRRQPRVGDRYWQAGLTVLNTLFDRPYLSTRRDHQGLILHSVYHRPNGWDHVPPGRTVPCGESSMWGDYHAREAALYVQRIAQRQTYLTFFGPAKRR